MTTHLILIHGAWQGSWAWQKIQPYFAKLNYQTYALDLPGNGSNGNCIEDIGLAAINIQTYVAAVAQIIEKIAQQPGYLASRDKIVLVAHSGGGVVATQAAESYADKISAVIYLAGMMLPPNLSFKALLEKLKTQGQDFAGIETQLSWNEDYSVSTVPPEAGAKIFLNDLPYSEALAITGQLTPQATTGLAISANWSADKFGQIPRLYVECTQDLSVKHGIQQIMQQLVAGAQSVTLDCGHAPHVSQPQQTANLVDNYLQALVLSH